MTLSRTNFTAQFLSPNVFYVSVPPSLNNHFGKYLSFCDVQLYQSQALVFSHWLWICKKIIFSTKMSLLLQFFAFGISWVLSCMQSLNFWKGRLETSINWKIIYFVLAKKRFALVTNLGNIYDIAQWSRVSDKTTISRQCFPVQARANHLILSQGINIRDWTTPIRDLRCSILNGHKHLRLGMSNLYSCPNIKPLLSVLFVSFLIQSFSQFSPLWIEWSPCSLTFHSL